MRRIETGMDAAEHLGQEAIACHHEEDAGLSEQQHQNDRRQRQEGGQTQQIPQRSPADLSQHQRQRLPRADQGLLAHTGERPTLLGQRRRTRRQTDTMTVNQRLSADGTNRPGGYQKIEHSTNA